MRELPHRARRTPRFQPRITLSLLYFAVIFFALAFAFVAPELAEVARSTTPGPAQQELAREAVRSALRPRLPLVTGLALVLTGLGIYAGWLPGTRARR